MGGGGGERERERNGGGGGGGSGSDCAQDLAAETLASIVCSPPRPGRGSVLRAAALIAGSRSLPISMCASPCPCPCRAPLCVRLNRIRSRRRPAESAGIVHSRSATRYLVPRTVFQLPQMLDTHLCACVLWAGADSCILSNQLTLRSFRLHALRVLLQARRGRRRRQGGAHCTRRALAHQGSSGQNPCMFYFLFPFRCCRIIVDNILYFHEGQFRIGASQRLRALRGPCVRRNRWARWRWRVH
jgi:hypothetical protein